MYDDRQQIEQAFDDQIKLLRTVVNDLTQWVLQAPVTGFRYSPLDVGLMPESQALELCGRDRMGTLPQEQATN